MKRKMTSAFLNSGSFNIVPALLIAMLILCSCSSSSSSNEGNQAALDGLEALRNMAQLSEYDFFGYESSSDIGKETLGDPIKVKTLDFEALVSENTPRESMIIDDDTYLFPVLVKGKAIGGVITEYIDGEWEFVSTGSKTIVTTALNMIRANGLNEDSCYLLDLEEIDISFIGYEKNGRNILIPLYSSDELQLMSGVSYNFTDIAQKIKLILIDSQEDYENMIPSESDDEALSGPSLEEVFNVPASPLQALETPKTEKILNVELIAQEEEEWCWAATGRMTMLYAGGDASAITQCAEANNAFNQNSCCDDGGTTSCNKPYRPMYADWGFTAEKVFDPYGAAMTWGDYKKTIDAGEPVAYLWRWRAGGGHYMVAVGYYEDATTYPPIQMVLMNNPWPPNVGRKECITYAKWVGGDRYNNRQTCYFYNIKKR